MQLAEQDADDHDRWDGRDHGAMRAEIADVRRKVDRLMTVLVGLLVSALTAAIALSFNLAVGALKN